MDRSIRMPKRVPVWTSCLDMYGTNTEKRCVGCGSKLQGRQRIWCSSGCDILFWENHQWGMARKAALKRDHRRCVRCGSTGLRHGYQRPWGIDKHYSYKDSLEVNHKVPVMGRHATNGCHHHLDGLETLCHECHVDETNRQFHRGKYSLA